MVPLGVTFQKSRKCDREAAKRLGELGVTSFLATVVSSSHATYKEILPVLRKYMGKPKALSSLEFIWKARALTLHKQKLMMPMLSENAVAIKRLERSAMAPFRS